MSNGYFAGRGGPIAQANFNNRGAFLFFAIGGSALGEESGPMFGAGVELGTRGRVGFRATVQDYREKVSRAGALHCAPTFGAVRHLLALSSASDKKASVAASKC